MPGIEARQRRHALRRMARRETRAVQTPLEVRLSNPLKGSNFAQTEIVHYGGIEHITVRLSPDMIESYKRFIVRENDNGTVTMVNPHVEYKLAKISSGNVPNSMAVRSDSTDRVQRAKWARKAYLAKVMGY